MNSPKEVAQNYIAIGVGKTKLSVGRMLALSLLAGMFIALAGVGSTIASVTVASPSLAKLISAAVFPVGLAMVLVAGSELFTGNSLLIIPVLERQAKVTGMIKNWVFVYIGNLVGGVLVAALSVYSGTFDLFSNAAAVSVIRTAVAKVSLSFGDALLRGILCNFLVCIAVWISFAAKDVVGKIAGLYLPIMLFVLSGYEHSVANMYYISAGLFAAKNTTYAAAASDAGVNLSKLNWGSMFTKNLLPVTIGNIIGGLVLVGVLYWFVYLSGGKKKEPAKKKK
ncbi:MAG: formate/nitrite transporter family protein [Oscillospiraceae bacterium]|jgi:formate/nitrite transporter|nr:formate/nitrite transporter family protein [Oscillospiraceae bacterium]